MPATAPIAAAMPQPSATIQPTRMPTSRADSRVGGRCPHGKADARVAEEEIKQHQHNQRHEYHARVVHADQVAAEQRHAN